jgi:hypothetical protein
MIVLETRQAKHHNGCAARSPFGDRRCDMGCDFGHKGPLLTPDAIHAGSGVCFDTKHQKDGDYLVIGIFLQMDGGITYLYDTIAPERARELRDNLIKAYPLKEE